MSTLIAVIDGKGGGLGKAICQRLSDIGGLEIVALGTNSLATSSMLKAGANDGATGENAICHIASKADIIVGPIGILVANSMMGEITEKMASGIANCSGEKLLLPMQKCSISVVGVKQMSIKQMLDEVEEEIKKRIS